MTSPSSLLLSINYQNYPDPSLAQKVLAFSSNLLNFSGRTAYVIPEHKLRGKEGVVILDSPDSFLRTTFKVLFLSTLIFPLLNAAVFLTLRLFYDFHVIDIESMAWCWNPQFSDSFLATLNQEALTQNLPQPIMTYALRDMTVQISKPTPEENPLLEKFEIFQQATKVCMAYNFFYLFVPRAKLLPLKNGCVALLTEKMSGQLSPVQELASLQAAQFMLKTQLIFDLENIGHGKLALTNLRRPSTPQEFEDFVCDKLQKIESLENGNKLLKEAEALGMEVEAAKVYLEHWNRLDQFYKDNSLLKQHPGIALMVNLELFEQADRKKAQQIIEMCNRTFLKHQNEIQSPPNQRRTVLYSPSTSTQEDDAQRERILAVLLKEGHIFDVIKKENVWKILA